MPADAPPAAGGYRLPAEWEPHHATWVAWPHNPATWPGRFEPVPAQFAHFVRTLAAFEPVHVLAGGVEVMAAASHWLGDVPAVTLWDIPTNDAWCRDHGPMFLSGPPELPPALVDWEYNAWGGKYPPFDRDNAVPREIARRLGFRRFAPGIVLEGGAVEGNGRGTILTTETCLLHPNRNPALGREDIERYLAEYCGARHVLWLSGHGIAGDDTDGHIDQLARFVNPTTVVAMSEENAADENHGPLQENLARLRAMRDQDGRPLDVVPLRMPRPKYVGDQRVPAGYANFYIANGAVLVPQFEDPADEAALAVLRDLFPGRRVIGLPSLDLVWGLGSFHCMTQQQPAASVPSRP
jgi:agmatine deiminase